MVHFGRGVFDVQNAVVEEVEIDCFSQGKPIRIIESNSCFSADEIVARAECRIGEQKYDLFENNCEHFANWCRSGQSESHQVNLTEALARQSAAVITKPWVRNWAYRKASKMASAKVTGVAARLLTRSPAIVAGVADAVQAVAEVISIKQGKTKDESHLIGRQAAIASSVALGWIVGGPVTAAAGTGIWFCGQITATQAVESGKQAVAMVLCRTGRKQPSQ